jgi:MFS family permease
MITCSGDHTFLVNVSGKLLSNSKDGGSVPDRCVAKSPEEQAADHASDGVRTARYAWVVVGLLWLIGFLNYLDRQVLFSVFAVLRSSLKLSDAQLGLLSTFFLWTYAFASPFGGFLSDRFGRKRVVVASLLSWSVTCWAVGHARSFAYLAAGQVLMGICESCYIPTGLALIADYHGSRTRSLATGLHQSGIYLGIVAGGAGGGWIAEHYGWRHAFTTLGLVGMLYTPLIVALLKDKPREKSKEEPRRQPQLLASVRELMRLSGYPTMLIVFGMNSMGGWLIMTWLPLYLYERYHMSLVGAGFSATFYTQAAGLGGVFLGGPLSDLWSRRTSKARLLIQAGGLMVAVPFIFLVGVTSSQLVSTMSLIAYGFGLVLYDINTMPVLCQVARPDLRATGYGLFNLSGTLLGGATAGLAGLLKSSLGIGRCLQGASILFFVSAFLLWRLTLSKTKGPVLVDSAGVS